MKYPLLSVRGLSLQEIVALAKEMFLSKEELQFLTTIYSMAAATETGTLELADVAKRSQRTDSAIRKRLDQLVEKGVVSKSYEDCLGKRKGAHYLLSNLDVDRSQVWQRRKEEQTLPLVRPTSSMVLSKEFDGEIGYDDLYAQVLFPCFSMTRRPSSDPFTTNVTWYKHKVLVTTSCISGKQPAHISDLKYLIAVYSLCQEMVSTSLKMGVDVRNSFHVNVADILHLMGRTSSGGEIESCLSALTRLASTVFEISKLPEDVLERYGIEHREKMFQPITELGKTTTGGARKSYFVDFSVSDVVMRGFMGQRYGFYPIDPAVFMIKQPIMLAFSLWCRQKLRRKRSSWYSNLGDIHLQIAQHLTFADFFASFTESLASYADKDPEGGDRVKYEEKGRGRKLIACSASVMGYKVRLAGKDVIISPIHTDPYVGLLPRNPVLKATIEANERANALRGIGEFE